MAEKQDHNPMMVQLPYHPDKAMMDAVADTARGFYGVTPEALEAVGFFMAAYNNVMLQRLGILS